ncbi:MAG: hypothetical protein Tsb0010_15980 [Parvularculaceae bacterium]
MLILVAFARDSRAARPKARLIVGEGTALMADNFKTAHGAIAALFDICSHDGGRHAPCGYHRDRHRCSFLELPAIHPQEDDDGLLELNAAASPALIELGRRYVNGRPPAGSWALAASQRDWLRARLAARLEERAADEPLRVMVAGVAGYVHFLGALAIFDAALASAPGARLDITVVDACPFPLDAVSAFDALIRTRRGGLFAPKLRVPPFSHALPREIAARARELKNLDRIAVKTQTADILALGADPGWAERFHVITDHFVSSMYNKDRHREYILGIRRAYYALLAPGGRLLSADGYTARDGANAYDAFVEDHRAIGFVPGAPGKPVWDPYGFTEQLFKSLADLSENDMLPVTKDNMLSEFEKA